MTARKTTPKKAPAQAAESSPASSPTSAAPKSDTPPTDGASASPSASRSTTSGPAPSSGQPSLEERAAAEAQDLGRKADEEDKGLDSGDDQGAHDAPEVTTDEVLAEMRGDAAIPVKQWWAELPDDDKNALRRGLPEKGYVAVGNAMDHGELNLDGQKLAEVWPLVTGRPVPDLHDALREMLRAGVGSHTYGALRQLGEDLFGAEWSQGL